MISGIIDDDYEGSIQLLVHNVNDFSVRLETGRKIAQMILQSHNPDVYFKEIADKLMSKSSKRGTGGFGSTDKKVDVIYQFFFLFQLFKKKCLTK